MAKQLHIYAYGDVENIQVSDSTEWGVVSLKDITDKINANPDADEIIVHIHSRGGDVNEGFAIHDALVGSGKKIITIVEGLCASIATVIALAAKKDDRKMMENSSYFIHNPWNFAIGDAETMRKNAELLDQAESKLIDFYAKKTGADVETIKQYMKDETSFTAEQARDFGFISEVIETVNNKIKIYAKINPMKPKKVVKNQAGTGTNEDPKALDLKTIDGKTLHVVTEAAEPATGDAVTIDGANVNEGAYELEDGTVINVDGESKIASIEKTQPEETEQSNAELVAKVNAMQKQIESIEAIKNQLKNLESSKNDADAKAKADAQTIASLQNEITDLKAKIKTGFKPDEQGTKFRAEFGGLYGNNEGAGTEAAKRYKERAQQRNQKK